MSLFTKDYYKDIKKDRTNWPINKIYKWYMTLPKRYRNEWLSYYGTIGQIRDLHEKYGLLFGFDDRLHIIELDSTEKAEELGIEVMEWSH